MSNRRPRAPRDRLLNMAMRWIEIVEASAAEKAQKLVQKQRSARDKIAAAQRKRSEASRKYQDQMRAADDSDNKRRDAGQRLQDQLRSANDAQQAAQAKLRTS